MLEILFQDNYLVAVNKPSGLLVHRTELARGEMEAAVQLLRDQIGQRVYPVHRLDRGTSGVLLMALDSTTASQLGAQFMQREVKKEYSALVRGHVDESGSIDYPLAKLNEEKGRSRFKIEGTEQECMSHYQQLKQYELPLSVSKYPSTRLSHVKVMPEQGRKHQIRRHFKHVFHPLIGDTRYGCRHCNKTLREAFDPDLRLMLHSESLTVNHPNTGRELTIKSDNRGKFDELLTFIEPYRLNT
ncbi:pseudouridine synthase [Marinomonas balearica]|uniref:tRNA pseudouridine synthase C n=1 Tax=Marinomonas balearica TaxID=491947 RepID=A0A4R6M5Z9_9GAMM|nr:pseudouridine synthase [Marinomonas balearica]TDO96787.1 tRNA pseudouridine synthase C [Marinomonas balearica]